MKLPYSEGSCFGIPLRQGGFAVGVVARASINGRVLLCYCFGPRLTVLPVKYHELEVLRSSDAIKVFRIGDLSLIRGDWPIIGKIRSWDRKDWPVPQFIRRDSLTGRAWRVHYSDSDPNVVDREEPEQYESQLENDAVLGAGALELVLTKLLEGGPR